MTECTCTHDSDLHALDDIGFVEGPPGEEMHYIRLRWRFSCAGRLFGLRCRCANFQPIEAKKEVQ